MRKEIGVRMVRLFFYIHLNTRLKEFYQLQFFSRIYNTDYVLNNI